MNLTKAVQVFHCTMGHPMLSAKALETAHAAYLEVEAAKQLHRLCASKKELYIKEYAAYTAKGGKPNYAEPSHVQATRKWLQLYDSATARNKVFTLEISDVEALITIDKCEYTGVEFNLENKRSIDRLDPSKGYEAGNVFAVTAQVNHIKNVLLESESDARIPFRELVALVDTLYQKGFTNE